MWSLRHGRSLTVVGKYPNFIKAIKVFWQDILIWCLSIGDIIKDANPPRNLFDPQIAKIRFEPQTLRKARLILPLDCWAAELSQWNLRKSFPYELWALNLFCVSVKYFRFWFSVTFQKERNWILPFQEREREKALGIEKLENFDANAFCEVLLASQWRSIDSVDSMALIWD